MKWYRKDEQPTFLDQTLLLSPRSAHTPELLANPLVGVMSRMRFGSPLVAKGRTVGKELSSGFGNSFKWLGVFYS